MERRPINPWSWPIELGFDQAQLIEGHRRQLVCSGRDAVDADGAIDLATRIPAARLGGAVEVRPVVEP